MANCYTAIELGVEVVPVLNKIDLPSAEPGAGDRGNRGRHRHRRRTMRCAAQRQDRRWACEDILEAVIARIPPPKGDPDAPLKALIIDSWFDNYVGVVMLVRVVDGVLQAQGQDPVDGDRRAAPGRAGRRVHAQVADRASSLSAGEVGFVIAGIKELQERQGRRHRHPARPARREALPGFKEIKPQVFAGLYPVESQPVRGAARRAGQAAS